MILALVAAPLLASAEETRYTLAYRPRVGERTKVRVVAVYKIGGPTIEYEYALDSEVLTVEKDGSYSARLEIGAKISRLAGKPEVRDEEGAVGTMKYNGRGELLPDEDEDEPAEDDPVNDLMRLAVGYEPKAAVLLGDSWTPPMDERLNLYPLRYTLAGTGPYDGHTELMLQGKGPGRDGANVTTQVWIDAATFARRKAIVHITEAPTTTGNDGDVLVTIDSKTAK